MVVGQTGRYAQHVAVHRGLRQSKSRRGNGPGGIVSNARQGPEPLRRTGESAQLRDAPGRFLEISGPAVIAQALPKLHQLLLRRRRQGFHRGERFEKAGVVSHHRRHPRLLEHDLRHPDGVGVLGTPPGKVPGILAVPVQKRLPQLHEELFHCQIHFTHGMIISYPALRAHPPDAFFQIPLDFPPSGRYIILSERGARR